MFLNSLYSYREKFISNNQHLIKCADSNIEKQLAVITDCIDLVEKDIPYKIHTNITIKELDRPGLIQAICIDSTSIKFLVRYFYNGALKEEYFLERELTKF